MDVIHAYVKPRVRKEANCATCRFSEITRSVGGDNVLLCNERMWDAKTLKCYLPKEENTDENS